MPANRSIKSDPPAPEDMGRVLRFEPRRRPGAPPSPSRPAPGEDVVRFTRDPEEREDYRHRMRTNLAAILVVGLLIWCGYWLFDTLAEMRKLQDCALSGRTNCVTINVPMNR